MMFTIDKILTQIPTGIQACLVVFFLLSVILISQYLYSSLRAFSKDPVKTLVKLCGAITLFVLIVQLIMAFWHHFVMSLTMSTLHAIYSPLLKALQALQAQYYTTALSGGTAVALIIISIILISSVIAILYLTRSANT